MYCSLNDYLQEELGSFRGAGKSVVSDYFSPPLRRSPIPWSGCGGFLGKVGRRGVEGRGGEG